MRQRLFPVLVLALAAAGCRGREGSGGAGGAPPAPAIVTAETGDLLVRYLDSAGRLQPAASLADVPEESRQRVVVVDLAQDPESRGASAWVHVADLRAPGADGRYPVEVVPRARFEAELGRLRARPGPRVVMYATSWCPVCDKARKFLKVQGIRYVERDVEKDPAAARELQAKARQAGVRTSGVPVFDVGGTLVPGFDEGRLRSLLR